MKWGLRRIEKAGRAVEDFNNKYPVGTRGVIVRRPFRRRLVFAYTITEAAIVRDGRAVVRIMGTDVLVGNVRGLDPWSGYHRQAGQR
ncbi:hypothetical protein [Arthrobacter koreensis]|uniref:hypothetical protein n=1 Tax=Arthrobacter koreensis TaxID=199136 RepID=UPI0037F7CE5C